MRTILILTTKFKCLYQTHNWSHFKFRHCALTISLAKFNARPGVVNYTIL